MPTGVVKHGTVYPLEPLPPDWIEGTQVRLERVASPELSKDGDETIDQWAAEVEQAASEIQPEDEAEFLKAINEIRAQAKQLARQGKR